MKIRKAILAMPVLAAVILAGCSQRRTVRHCSGSVWNTTYSVTYTSGADLTDSILEVMHEVEMSLSPFADSSLVNRINRGETMATDTLFRRILLASIEVNRLSGGAFDPTVSPLVNLWGFGFRDSGREPTQADVDSALRYVGIWRCGLDGKTLSAPDGVEFNFSAITKGYACDLIGEMLRRNGSEDFMVEIGGEIALGGKNPRGEPWHIQIDAPVAGKAPGAEALTVIEAGECGIATSGNYRNFREKNGRRAWHTINPQTGYPAETMTLSATVIAPDCMLADALATACMAMPPLQALAMVEALEGVEVMIVGRGADSEALEIALSRNFPLRR